MKIIKIKLKKVAWGRRLNSPVLVPLFGIFLNKINLVISRITRGRKNPPNMSEKLGTPMARIIFHGWDGAFLAEN